MKHHLLYPIKSVGKYCLFLRANTSNMLNWKVYLHRTLDECVEIGINSLTIVTIVSIFIGAVSCIQISYNLVSPLAPRYLIGYGVRNMVILELSPTIMSIIFAGKIGSNIAGQLGSMKITEQISALEVMGVNATSYLVLPKILASIMMYPLLVILSGTIALYSGYLAAKYVVSISAEQYTYGLKYMFDPYTIKFALYKSLAFAFLVSSISAYKGFYVLSAGGAMAVGKASTEAVTNSCIAILAADYVLTQLLL